MPQMAPMNWLSLFFFFSILFVLSILINYYFYLFFYSNKISLKLSSQLNNNQKFWKW
nr:ATP synthase F0 subunit 8 [Ips hauseri]UUG47488.1 ATP synthase F0 subunit 8 [Ips hauseri]UUG47501.1 ATP synthase F0 subunit 8 [Ips hauseri]